MRQITVTFTVRSRGAKRLVRVIEEVLFTFGVRDWVISI